MLPDVFPWVGFLPEPDARAFVAELVASTRAADSINNSAAVAQMLAAWEHTAEAHSDPDVSAALTKDHETDCGPVPAPGEVA
ncbi:hypothetical protein [Streptomyces sp. NPDC001678]|uniref:hypothetical protein n=1 Tax=Streptomyces sp. NPDC001678 TaxID=3364599 RepID=UPI0036C5ABB8